MVITDRLKQLIFKHLYRELGDCEIIPYNGSTWFINRDNKHWYFELAESGTLWWRYDFFNLFFQIFSMSSDDFCPVLSSWVEEVLNHKVLTTHLQDASIALRVEEVLNHKVLTTESLYTDIHEPVEDVLNHKVSTTCDVKVRVPWKVEEVLNSKVSTINTHNADIRTRVEDVLSHNVKVSTTTILKYPEHSLVEEVLNHKVSTLEAYSGPFTRGVEEVLNNKECTTDVEMSVMNYVMEQVLNQ